MPSLPAMATSCHMASRWAALVEGESYACTATILFAVQPFVWLRFANIHDAMLSRNLRLMLICLAAGFAFLIWTFLAGSRVIETMQHLAWEGMDTMHRHRLLLPIAVAAAMEAAAKVEVHTVPCPTQALAILMAASMAITKQAAILSSKARRGSSF